MSKAEIRKCAVCELELEVLSSYRSFWRQRFEFNVIANTKLIKSDGYSSDEIVYSGELCLDCYHDYRTFVKKSRKQRTASQSRTIH